MGSTKVAGQIFSWERIGLRILKMQESMDVQLTRNSRNGPTIGLPQAPTKMVTAAVNSPRSTKSSTQARITSPAFCKKATSPTATYRSSNGNGRSILTKNGSTLMEEKDPHAHIFI